MDVYNYTLFWICVVGLCLGSFYNVVILRSLSNESIVFPPSKCPKCGHKLYFWQNIPVISYILLRGKCYFCKEKISLQYPMVEIITMVSFVLVYLKFGLSWNTLFVLFWVSGLIIMSATDLKESIVDCNIAILMAISGIIYNFINEGWYGGVSSCLGLIAGFIILEIVARFGYVYIKSRAMGEADSYVAGAIGAIFTISGVLQILFYSLIASMIFILPIFLYKKFKQKEILTIVSFIFFVISIILYKFFVQNYYSMLFLIVSGIVLASVITKNIRKEENINRLPFVPALALGIIYGIYLM